jgi:hypothetical protein
MNFIPKVLKESIITDDIVPPSIPSFRVTAWPLPSTAPAASRYSPQSAAPRRASAAAHCSAAALDPNFTAVEYRGIRYIVRARIEREQWYVAIHPGSVEMTGGRIRITRRGRIAGSRVDRQVAEKTLHAKSKIKLTPTFLRRTRAAGSGLGASDLDLKDWILRIALVQSPRLLCKFPDLNESWAHTMSHLVLSCAKTGKAFNSGLETTADDLRFVPPTWTARLRCAVCGEIHDFKFAGARLCECPPKCPQYHNCQLCIAD